MPLPPDLRRIQERRHELEYVSAALRTALLEAIVAARLAGYTNQEIADACGMSEAGVRKLLAKPPVTT